MTVADFNIILFDDFETLDAFGPAEIVGRRPDLYNLGYFSMYGEIVTSRQKVRVKTQPFSELNRSGILLIPGGQGTKNMSHHRAFIQQLKDFAEEATYVLAVCTGSTLLAKTGLLDGRNATCNKRSMGRAQSIGKEVNWDMRARWVVDGKYYTSSGVATGLDMVLGFIHDVNGPDVTQDICEEIEYIWNSDASEAPYAGQHT